MNINSELKGKLIKLSEEFDSLGVETINVNVDVIEQLICSTYGVINLYRRECKQSKETNLTINTMKSEQLKLQKNLLAVKDELEDNRKEKKRLLNDSDKQTRELNEMCSRNEVLQKEINKLKAFHRNKHNESVHKINQLKEENRALKERVGEAIGTYRSSDALMAEALQKMKVKEEIYEDTIKKMQLNNELLISQVVDLKEEIVNVIAAKK